MAVTDTRMNGWVKLKSDADYVTLKTTGKYTQDGRTIDYDDRTVYITPSNGIGGSTLQGNTAVVTNAAGEVINSGVTATELSYVTNARSNIQKQIDDLKAQIGTGTNNYFAATFDDINYDQPGNWYIENGDGTYFYGIVDDNGSFKPVRSRVDPSEIGQQDLSSYQKKIDTTLVVRDKNNIPQSTVVGSINAIEEKLGNGLPAGKTVTGLINEIIAGGGGGGTVTITGTNGITVTTPTVGTFAIGHLMNGTTTARTYGGVLSTGHAQLPIVTTDAYGHTTTTTAVRDFYIPSTAGTNGQVWTWDAANNRGAWINPTGGGGGSYTGDNGITIDGTVVKHVNTGKAKTIGSVGDALRMTVDDQGHVTEVVRTMSANTYISGDDWKLVQAKGTADEILSGSWGQRLVNSAAIYDIMGGMRIKKMTQAAYDALTTKASDTIYIIVG